MSWVRFIFSFQGRLNRLQALTGLYGIGLMLMLALVLGSSLIGQVAPGDGIVLASSSGAFVLVGLAVMLASQIAIFVRRAHDLGLSVWVVACWLTLVCALVGARLIWPMLADSWLELVLVIPVVLAAFWVLLEPGQPMANRFGEPPRPGWLP